MTSDATFQFSLRTLFFATTVAGLNAAASVSGNFWMISLSLTATSVVVSLLLVVYFRFSCLRAAYIALICCIFHCALWGASQSIYLLLFARDRAMTSIGLGNPISAGILAGILGLPLALIAFLISLIVGFEIELSRRDKTKRYDKPAEPFKVSDNHDENS